MCDMTSSFLTNTIVSFSLWHLGLSHVWYETITHLWHTHRKDDNVNHYQLNFCCDCLCADFNRWSWCQNAIIICKLELKTPEYTPTHPSLSATCTRVSCGSIVCFWRRVRDCAEIPRRPCRRRAAHGVRIQTRGVDDDCFDYFKISLVSLVEGLCSLDSSLRCYVFRKKKYLKEKKQLLQSLIPSPSPSICIPMCTLYTYTNTYMLRFSSSGFSGSKTGCWCQVDSSSVYAQ